MLNEIDFISNILNEDLDFNQILQSKNEENLTYLRDNIDSDFVRYKIQQYIKKYPFITTNERDVVNKIMADDMFAVFFMKDAKKQNVIERKIAEYISNIDGVSNFKMLGSTSKVFVKDGKITSTRIAGNKSIDYYFEYKGKKFYCIQKFIEGSGGAQDNQYHDLLSFAKEIRPSEDYFVFLCDGNFFTPKKLQTIRDFANHDNVIITDVRNLDGWLKKI